MTPIRETIARAALNSLPNRTVAYVDLRNLSTAVVSGSADLLAMADAVLRALDEAGCVVVPKEPNEAMQKAGAILYIPEVGAVGLRASDAHPVTAAIYRAMISAAKEPA